MVGSLILIIIENEITISGIMSNKLSMCFDLCNDNNIYLYRNNNNNKMINITTITMTITITSSLSFYCQ